MTKLRLTPAERMRLYRKRQRQGLQYVRILLHVTDIDGLIHLGLLKDDQRTDADAPQVRFWASSTGQRSVTCNGFDRPK